MRDAANQPKARMGKAIEVLGQVHGKAWDIIPQLDKYPSGSSKSSRLRADRLGMSAKTAVGFCGNLFGVTEEENAVRERELMAFSEYSATISEYLYADSFHKAIGYLDDIRYG